MLLEEDHRLILVDTGIGILDTQHPAERIGQPLIDRDGFRFDEALTAIRQIERMGLHPQQVTDCIISHLDADHIGGLADFPQARVHVSIEEYENSYSGNPRYLPHQLDHKPPVKTYQPSTDTWFGFEARKVNLPLDTEIYLVPLFGHTLGHCGVAIGHDNRWLFYIGDAYYMWVELSDTAHPVHELAAMNADNNELRMKSLDNIRKLLHEQPGIEVVGYHDIEEFKVFEAKPSSNRPNQGIR